MVTYKFCPGARYQSALGTWLPVVRVFRDNKPVGSKVGKARASESAARDHAVRAANRVAAKVAIAGCEFTVMPLKESATAAAPAPIADVQKQHRDATVWGNVNGARILQVQI